MTSPSAFKASYADWKLIKTRGVVQVVMEVPLADADAAYKVLGGMPDFGKEVWFGIAPIQLPAPAKEKPAQPQPKIPTAGAKRDWRDMQPAQQAGIRCAEPIFVAFLKETYPDEWRDLEEDSADVVRFISRYHIPVATQRCAGGARDLASTRRKISGVESDGTRMSRSTPEWIGATDDSAIPARVKVRVFDKLGGCCALCTRRICGTLRPAYDHDVAIINGGRNAESNLQLLCMPCHAGKTKARRSRKGNRPPQAFKAPWSTGAPQENSLPRIFPRRTPTHCLEAHRETNMK